MTDSKSIRRIESRLYENSLSDTSVGLLGREYRYAPLPRPLMVAVEYIHFIERLCHDNILR